MSFNVAYIKNGQDREVVCSHLDDAASIAVFLSTVPGVAQAALVDPTCMRVYTNGNLAEVREIEVLSEC
jgi:hypothetical protein